MSYVKSQVIQVLFEVNTGINQLQFQGRLSSFKAAPGSRLTKTDSYLWHNFFFFEHVFKALISFLTRFSTRWSVDTYINLPSYIFGAHILISQIYFFIQFVELLPLVLIEKG